jgi:hypothetical protein
LSDCEKLSTVWLRATLEKFNWDVLQENSPEYDRTSQAPKDRRNAANTAERCKHPITLSPNKQWKEFACVIAGLQAVHRFDQFFDALLGQRRAGHFAKLRAQHVAAGWCDSNE